MALGKSNRRSKKFVPPKLQMTSMMDMFTILLIFLIVSFSQHIVRFKIEGDMQLPSSSSKTDYKETVRLVVLEDSLWVGDERVTEIKDGTVVGLDPNNLKGSVLYQRLRNCRNEIEKSKEEGIDKTLILFLCDKRLSFKTINSIIKTAGIAGFPNFQFGVLKQ